MKKENKKCNYFSYMNLKFIASISTLGILIFTTFFEFIFVAFLIHIGSKSIISLSVFVIIILISIGIGAVVNYIVYYQFYKPISDLNRAMQEIAQGNLNVHLTPGKYCRVYEIVNVMEHFNDMAWELSNTETFHDDFITNVSHEFKTPISAIEGYATLLGDANNTPEEQKRYINSIISNTKRLSKLTGNILEIAKLDNHKLMKKENVFSLDEQIRQVLLSLEPKWTEKNMQLNLELEETYVCSVEGWLIEVWSNLLDNAIKYSKQNGMLSIQIMQKKDVIKVQVSDQGIGMTQEECKHVFDKFYQADTSHKGEGNGLGLALVKRIMDACGGRITVSSQKEEGTTFTVELPKKM